MPAVVDEKEGIKALPAMFMIFFFIISNIFYMCGIDYLVKASLAVSPALVHLFRSFLATSMCYSLYCGFTVCLHILKFPQLPTSETLSAQVLVANLKCSLTCQVASSILGYHASMFWPFRIMKMGAESTLSVFLILAAPYMQGTFWALRCASLQEWSTNSPSKSDVLWRKRKFVEFGLGKLGSILFQNFVKLTSMEHIVAFLCLAMVWIHSSMLIRPSTDLGFLTFLLGNVSLGCTVNIYGIKGHTYMDCVCSSLLVACGLMALSLAFTTFVDE